MSDLKLIVKLTKDLTVINSRLDKLEELVKKQSQMILNLQTQLHKQKQ
jgi:hypothetical protein